MPGSESRSGPQPTPPAASGRKIALLVGNANYPGCRLANPVNDVRLIERAMRLLNFDVEVVLDATKAQLETAIVRFGERLEQAERPEASFFYYAGHGIQYQGSNYLLPIDAEIPATRYLKSGAVKVDAVVEELARKTTAANIVVLDACRDNPIPEAYHSTRDVTQGLAGIHNVPRRTLVAFSTSAGAVALDGEGMNSPYAATLAGKLTLPGRSILDVFGEVAAEVESLTGGRQSPALFMQGAPPRIVLRPPVASVRTEAETAAAIDDQPRQPTRQYVSFSVGDGSTIYTGKRSFLAGNGVHEFFRDNEAGPEMVVVPAGPFMMGDDEDGAATECEGPAHAVTIARPFALGRCCVTVGEYRRFVEATGHVGAATIYALSGRFLGIGDLIASRRSDRSWRRPGFAQTDDHPVVGVSWADASAYVTWLAASTGQSYRLPSEAEWEYAARAGSGHRYAWGQVITRAHANFDDSPDLRRRHPTAWRYRTHRGTCPAGLFDPNAWGLVNMHGNVEEWVEDDWHDTYAGAPSDGSPWVSPAVEDGSTRRKVVRGGSWTGTASDLRSAARASHPAGFAASWIGFRVARDLLIDA